MMHPSFVRSACAALLAVFAISCTSSDSSSGAAPADDPPTAETLTCGPGKYTKGTMPGEQTCEPCAAGTFNGQDFALEKCTPMTECSSNEPMLVEGSAVQDRICEKPWSHDSHRVGLASISPEGEVYTYGSMGMLPTISKIDLAGRYASDSTVPADAGTSRMALGATGVLALVNATGLMRVFDSLAVELWSKQLDFVPVSVKVNARGEVLVFGRNEDAEGPQRNVITKYAPDGQLSWTATPGYIADTSDEEKQLDGPADPIALLENGDVLYLDSYEGLFDRPGNPPWFHRRLFARKLDAASGTNNPASDVLLGRVEAAPLAVETMPEIALQRAVTDASGAIFVYWAERTPVSGGTKYAHRFAHVEGATKTDIQLPPGGERDALIDFTMDGNGTAHVIYELLRAEGTLDDAFNGGSENLRKSYVLSSMNKSGPLQPKSVRKFPTQIPHTLVRADKRGNVYLVESTQQPKFRKLPLKDLEPLL